MPDEPSDDAVAGEAEEISAIRRELEASLARAERLRRQRDEARTQRDFARAQRDDARRQRDNLKLAVPATAEDELHASLAANGAGSALNLVAAHPALRKRARKRTPSGFAALPKTDLPSAPYSLVKFEERERARRLLERRIEQRLASGEALTLAEREIGAHRKVPHMRRDAPERSPPGPEIAFVTVADIGFLPGLSGLLLSLLGVYPELRSTIYVFHDGTITGFAQERLVEIYPNLEFVVPEMDWLDLTGIDLADAKRIGKLGYTKFLALTLSGYQRVVILDADLMILDDISALWLGSQDDARAIHDLGNREIALESAYTGHWIINSGVISLPGGWCTPAEFDVAKEIVCTHLLPLSDLLDQFADQKAWNVYLARKGVTILESNYNCNVKFVGRFLGGKLEGVSVLHFAGPKPWNSIDFLSEELVSKRRAMACVFPNLWIDRYRTLLFKSRSIAYRRDKLARAGRVSGACSRTCVVTDEWSNPDAVRAHAREGADVIHVVHADLPWWFEETAPRHVVFASHDYLGGTNTFDPKIPADCAQRIADLPTRPTVWAPFYFKPIFEIFATKFGIEVRYVLHEAPFVRNIVDVGVADFRADGFVDSCGDDTLTFGSAVAVSCGYRELVLTSASSVEDAEDAGEANSLAMSLLRDGLSENGVTLVLSRQPAAPASVPLLAQAAR